MKYTCAIFDLDGTLIDSMEAWYKTKGNYIGNYGYEVPSDMCDRLAPLELERCTAYLSKNYPNIGKPASDIMADIVAEMKRRYLTDVTVKPGIKEFLDRLKSQGVTLCVATASRLPMVMAVLEHHDLLRRFDYVVNTEMTARDKMSPDVYIYAAGRAGARVVDSVVFEDAGYAAKSAKSAGFTVVGIDEPWSPSDSSEMQEICDMYIKDFTCVPVEFWD